VWHHWDYKESLNLNIPFYGPELAFSVTDRSPAPELNPFGLSGFGRGDWWLLPIEDDYELCIGLETDPAEWDDVEVFLVDNSGQEVTANRFDGGFWKWLQLSVEEGDTLRLWAAPRSITSEFGWYYLEASECLPPAVGSPAMVRGSRSIGDPIPGRGKGREP
jgi:hypothetical protein